VRGRNESGDIYRGRNADARRKIARTTAPQCRWDEIYWRLGGAGPAQN